MTRILVTGGAGYVGSVSVEALLAAGHQVAVLDDLTTGHADAVPDGAILVAGDYGDHLSMTILLADHGIEAILHCGARSLVGESLADPARYYRDNVRGGISLLEAAREVGVKRFVLSSTAAVYGVPETTPIPEDAELRPINPYGETKRTLEAALAWYGRAYGLRSVSLRYFNVAGATERLGEDHDPETHLIPAILRAVEAGKPMTLFGDDYPTPDGTCVRDYIHVADLADAHLRALEATARDGGADADAEPALVCNLGNGGGFSNLEVIRAAETVVGRKIDYTVGPRREGDPPILVASAQRAAELLGWRPTRPSLEEMIGSAWAWRRTHPDGYAD
jgi:UDP-glucose-4-epimerase GalE